MKPWTDGLRLLRGAQNTIMMITVGVKRPFCSYLRTTIGLYLHWMMSGSMVMEMTRARPTGTVGGMGPGPPDYRSSTLPPELRPDKKKSVFGGAAA